MSDSDYRELWLTEMKTSGTAARLMTAVVEHCGRRTEHVAGHLKQVSELLEKASEFESAQALADAIVDAWGHPPEKEKEEAES